MNYKWNILYKADDLKQILNDILTWKNIPKDQIRQFIDFKMKPHDPYLLTNMDQAVKRIKLAVERNEKVLIAGDYDADGITGTAVLYIGLNSIFSNVIWRLPNRFTDGYGLNNRAIDYAKEQNCDLIVTVDNGIAAIEPIKYAKSLGIDVVVTDHHQLVNNLPTEIVVNPQIDNNYPFKSICGCMVGFKLINALIPDLEVSNPELYEELVSIVTIGTIADAMDLTDENRFYCKMGLKYLSKPKNIGLKALTQKLGIYDKDLDTDSVAYLIGPCINACGRLESPDIAMNLILSDDEVEADKLTDKIIKLNEKRKDMQKEAIDNLVVNEEDKFIIVTFDDIGHGILGIIAGKIAEKYQRPCFVLGGNEKEGKLSGSGRSVYNYNINSCVQANKDILSGGGHAAACGISLKFQDLEELKKRCNKHFSEWLNTATVDDLTPRIEAVCEIDLSLINERLISNINKLKPYGNGNSEPIFVSKNVDIRNAKVVGKNKNVIQMDLVSGWCTVKSVGFSDIKEKYDELSQPKNVDIIYSISLNEWPKGKFTPQLMLKDMRISE